MMPNRFHMPIPSQKQMSQDAGEEFLKSAQRLVASVQIFSDFFNERITIDPQIAAKAASWDAGKATRQARAYAFPDCIHSFNERITAMPRLTPRLPACR